MGIRGDDRPRPRSTTREEADLRIKLLEGRITFNTYSRRYKKLMNQGLIKRSGRVVRNK